MDIYILQKDLPDAKKGDEFYPVWKGMFYCRNGNPFSTLVYEDQVICNKEWFSIKEGGENLSYEKADI